MEFSAFQSFVQENAEWFRGVHPESPASLEQAEIRLGCTLPVSLKWLLSQWGYSGACGISSLADAVGTTLRCRNALGLPQCCVILNDWGDAGVVYLDARSGVVTWTDAHGLHRIVEGFVPDGANVFAGFPAWVAARLEAERTET